MPVHKSILLVTAFLLLFSGSISAQIITTVAGAWGDTACVDCPATACGLGFPYFVAAGIDNSFYFTDGSEIHRVNDAGIISTIAGSNSISGYSGDNGPASAAKLNTPWGLVIDGSGNLYFADAGNACVRKIDTSGIITTVAGTGGTSGFGGDNGPATAALMNWPTGVATDKNGNLFISDEYGHHLRKVSALGIISTLAGLDSPGFSGDGGPATAAEIDHPVGIAVDTEGNVFFADSHNNRVRKINVAGIITTIAGCDSGISYADNIPATTAQLASPMGIAADNYGNVFIADQYNNQIRKVNAAGIISTAAGFGIHGFSGDTGPAKYAFLAAPYDVCLDSRGGFYITDQDNGRIRYVNNTLATPEINECGAKLSLYPDPSFGSFTITIESVIPEDALVTITNVMGQEVQRYYERTNTTISITPEVDQGLYFVSAHTHDGVVTERILIMK